jgi:hypothetical protein
MSRGEYRTISVPWLRFSEIYKEPYTHGYLYVLWSSHKTVFMGQSLPPVVKMLEAATGTKIQTSGFYRILRQETKGSKTKGYYIKAIQSVDSLNEFLQSFDVFFVCSRNLYMWVVDESSVQKNKEPIVL